MKFVEFKKSLVTSIKPAYLFYGNDRYLISNALNNLSKACGEELKDINQTSFDAKSPIADILTNAELFPIGVNKRLIIIKDYVFTQETIKSLEQYLLNPNTEACLAFTSEQSVAIKGIEEVDCNKLTLPLIRSKIKADLATTGVSINEDAVELLCNYCDFDMALITTEVNKLAKSLVGTNIITVNDIKQNTEKDVNYNIFELTNALGNKNLDLAIKVSNYILQSVGTKGFVAAMYNYFHRLFYIAINYSLSDEEIAKILSIKPYAVKLSRPQTKLFGAKKLKEICSFLTEVDYHTKTTFASVENEAFAVIFTICQM